ncbi:MAG TPA: Gfo/Idh/MocA family oxidoreductase [Bryobacteraceae bacterium]|nr:Gfo/Idh/MocA family oxidoreductase [Bryobacteraceae bacterium]
MPSSRRTFVLSAGTALAATRVWGANDRVPVAVVGLGGRGRDHMNEYGKLPESEVVALCDVNQAALERGQAHVLKASGKQPRGFSDMRKLFEDKDVLAVSMPLPNHWHALATIWACQAGKDVYIEKPASHNIYEGQKMVEAARKYGRMVQVGSQSRSIGHKQKALKLLSEGIIGKVHTGRGLCYRNRQGIGTKPDQGTPPPGVDWSYFLGPAPMRPFNENRFAYNWHWFWDTGNGDIGNQGVHEMDILLWGLGPKLPTKIQSSGGRYIWNDQGETPNMQVATYDFGDYQAVFEVRNLPTNSEAELPMGNGSVVGNLFYGSEGILAVSQRGFQVYKGDKREKVMDEKPVEARDWDTSPHMRNFLQAVKSRRHQDLNADIEVGARAAAMCHLGNIAYRLGRTVQFDPQAQRFVRDPQADRLATRDYRKPYIVPEKV